MDMNHFIALLSIMIEKKKQTVTPKTVCYKLQLNKIATRWPAEAVA